MFDSIVVEWASTRKSIAVDLDGTLAESHGYVSWDYIGPPVQKMVERCLEKEREGYTIKVFTARCMDKRCIPIIRKWLKENGLPDWEITNVKTSDMKEIWDDLAIGIKQNTGEPR